MNKLGSVHSDGDNILAIGKKLSLRCMIDDWKKRNYWQRSIAYHDDVALTMYPNKRTYLQQIKDAVAGNCTELNLVIDSAGRDYSSINYFVIELIKMVRKLGYDKEIIIDCFNEPLEKFTYSEIDQFYRVISNTVIQFCNVSLAVGDMACNFTNYYSHLLQVDYKYKYISFHTDNDCDTSTLLDFLSYIPVTIPLINNEHYNYNGAENYGYNDDDVIKKLWLYTLTLLNDSYIKSVYICCPYGVQSNSYGDWLFLNKVNSQTEAITTTKAWLMLKEFDIESEVIMKLETLQKGSTNWQVRALQSCLIANGYEPGIIDNIFGAKTEEALKKFNDDHYIKNNIVCSLATWFTFIVSPNSMELMKDLITMLSIL